MYEVDAARLLARGMTPVRWAGTRSLLRHFGNRVELEQHPYIRVSLTGSKGEDDGRWWASAWAVFIAEAEPCAEAAREQAVRRAFVDDEFVEAAKTVAQLGDRAKFADWLMAEWNPTEG